jgi:hypothetical protein
MIVSLKAVASHEDLCRPRTISRQQPMIFDLTIGAPEIVVQTSIVLTALWNDSQFPKRSGRTSDGLHNWKPSVVVESAKAFKMLRF